MNLGGQLLLDARSKLGNCRKLTKLLFGEDDIVADSNDEHAAGRWDER